MFPAVLRQMPSMSKGVHHIGRHGLKILYGNNNPLVETLL